MTFSEPRDMRPYRRFGMVDARRARGIAMPIVLLFLLIITIAATFGIRRATLNEGITRNQLDFEVARQAAEAALRDGERDLVLPTGAKPAGAVCGRGGDRALKGRTGDPWFSTTCLRGQCRFLITYYDTSNYVPSVPANPQPWWPTTKLGQWNEATVDPKANCTFNGAVPIGTFTGSPQVSGVARQPEYLIEYLGRGESVVFRISARGFGADINTETVVQSYFRPALE